MNPKHVLQPLAAVFTAATLLSSAVVAPAALAHPVDPLVSTADYGKLALAFEANRGQTDPQVDFLARGHGYSLFLTPAEAVLVLAEGATSNVELPEYVLRVQLAGSNSQASAAGEADLPGTVNHLLGNDPTQWRTDVPTYARVRYQDIYPGVDVAYYGHQGQLEYDFIVAPGADPGRISLNFDGADTLILEESGDLVLHTSGGDIRQPRPQIYQNVDGQQLPVQGGFAVGEDRHVGFQLGAYDASRALVIDPALMYSTFLGGSGDENFSGNIATAGIAVDSSGSAYVVGSTTSANFPTTQTAQQKTAQGGGLDVFVAKLNPAGSALMYATYLGGSGYDRGTAIAIDKDNYAYVTGMTNSDTTFPRVNAYQNSYGGGYLDAFVTKLNQTGSALKYSTFLGGNGDLWGEAAYAIAVDGNYNAHVVGVTNSVNFPVVNAAQTKLAGEHDAFLTTFDATGSQALHSTFLGGLGDDLARAVAVDASGNTYMTGQTTSDQLAWPVNGSVFQPKRNTTYPLGNDAFVAKYSATGTRLYTTYLGGGGDDVGFGIAVDRAGKVYIAGSTGGTFYITPNWFNPTCLDPAGFVAKLNADASNLEFAGCLDAPGQDTALAIALDRAENVYVTGYTESAQFPTPDGFQTQIKGSMDAFVAKINATGTVLAYASFLGGRANDAGLGIAVDAGGHAYVTGYTGSADFPLKNPLLTNQALSGTWDGFVAKIDCDV